MPTALERRAIVTIDRLTQSIQRLRSMNMDNMPQDMMLQHMEQMAQTIGRMQQQLQQAQTELQVLRAAGTLPKQQQALQMMQYIQAWEQYRRRVLALPAGPYRDRLLGIADARLKAFNDTLGTATGQPGLGSMPVLSRDPEGLAAHADFQAMFAAFSYNVPKGSPPTPDVLTPDVFFDRHFRTRDVPMPDGQVVRFWGFTDPARPGEGDGAFPSDLIRIKEGVLFHCRMKPRIGTHTIHWHGIEPTAMNDGVGKLSFEVSGEYVYQWQAAEAGTYFYHCHHNTPLHFEFGMYGGLIVDPPKPAAAPGPDAPYPTGGPGFVRRADQTVPYDVEAIWVYDDVDPRWHTMSHDQGLGAPFGEDAGLNIFEPKYFLITGVPHPWSANRPDDPQHPGVAATVKAGQTLLVRIICAAYTRTTATIEGLDAEVIAFDARTLGYGPFCQYSQPFVQPAGQPTELTAARRFDALIKPTAAQVGTHRVRFEFYDYINDKLWGTAETVIHVVP